jgi:membrane protein DedA with SNARE-associated domain
MTGLAGLVADWAITFMNALGSPGAGIANAIDSIVPVLPSEVTLPLAGFAASRGDLNVLAVIVWTTIGSVAGSLVVYSLGAILGRDRTRAIAVRVPLVKPHDVDRVEAWFARHGTKTVLLGRMVPVFRVLISVPAGIERMPVGAFVLYTAIGSVLWNTAFVLAGYLLGANWRVVEEYGGLVTKAIVALTALVVGWFVVARLRRRTAGRHGVVRR